MNSPLSEDWSHFIDFDTWEPETDSEDEALYDLEEGCNYDDGETDGEIEENLSDEDE